MSKTRLTVKYINPQHDIDLNLDNEIIRAFSNLGFKWWGSELDLEEPFERDLSFTKPPESGEPYKA